MTSKELIQKLDSHMRVNKITRKSVADKLGVTSPVNFNKNENKSSDNQFKDTRIKRDK